MASMDGKGRVTGNIYIKSLWRSLKQENRYPKVYETGTDLYNLENAYFQNYGTLRLHQNPDYQQSKEAYKRVG